MSGKQHNPYFGSSVALYNIHQPQHPCPTLSLPARLTESSGEELEVVPRHNTRSDTQGVEASLRM